jgi:hypothetical protein
MDPSKAGLDFRAKMTKREKAGLIHQVVQLYNVRNRVQQMYLMSETSENARHALPARAIFTSSTGCDYGGGVGHPSWPWWPSCRRSSPQPASSSPFPFLLLLLTSTDPTSPFRLSASPPRLLPRDHGGNVTQHDGNARLDLFGTVGTMLMIPSCSTGTIEWRYATFVLGPRMNKSPDLNTKRCVVVVCILSSGWAVPKWNSRDSPKLSEMIGAPTAMSRVLSLWNPMLSSAPR